MEIVAKILLGLTLFSAAASLFLVVVTRLVFRRGAAVTGGTSQPLPPVSILKPLCGRDPELELNLEAFFTQDYPEYELVFACEKEDDPALKAVKNLCVKFPQVKAKVQVGSAVYGYNPKVNNLIKAHATASYDVILTSDSDVRPPKNYLKTIVSELLRDDDNKLVVNPIYARGDHSLGSILETLHLNSLILSGMAFLTVYYKKLGGFGKSMLLRRSDLEAVGGFKALANYFAEDYVLADRISKLPGKCYISRLLLPCITNQRTVGQFINRHGRWAQARHRIAGWSYPSEILANPIFWGWLYSAANLFSWASLRILIFATAFKILLDAFQGMVQGRNRKLLTYLLVPIKDLLTAILWFYPMMTDTVYWRGVRLRVTAGTKLKEAGGRKILGVRLSKLSFKKWLSRFGS